MISQNEHSIKNSDFLFRLQGNWLWYEIAISPSDAHHKHIQKFPNESGRLMLKYY